MSYILDALRKSDQLRQRGAAPTLLAGQTAAAAPRQPAFLWYGLLAGVLLAAGVAIGWLRPWQPEQPAPRAELVAAKPLDAAPRQPAPAPAEMVAQPKPELPLRESTPVAQSARAPAPAQTKPPLPVRARTETYAAPPESVGAASSKVAPMPEQPVGAGATDAARAETVISMAELPLSIQQELPAMTISVHAYSGKPADRLVGINNRLQREGEYVVPGLKLEQITPDGMIFSYKGYSFRRGVK